MAPYYLFCLLVLLSVSQSQAFSGSSSIYNNFLQCLKNQTNQPTITNILYSKQSPQYSTVLQAYIRNLRFAYPSTPKPVLIVTPLTPSHVSASVVCSCALGLHLKPRSGGHDYEGTSYVSFPWDNFVVLDMSRMRDIRVDPVAATAYVGAGATLGELYYRIQEKSKVLGFPAGVCPTVGVGGHVSGGGYGNMIRKYGLSVDHVVDAEVVDAKGRVLTRSTMGEDLFWAIRGGGGASFGVVVSFTVNLVPVPRTVTVFNVKRFIAHNATDLVYKWQLVMQSIDPNLFMRLLLQPVTNPDGGKQKTVRITFIALFLGDSDKLVTLLSSAFAELGITKQDCIQMSWAQSVLFWNDGEDKSSPLETLLNRTYDSDFLKRKSDYVQTPITKPMFELLWKKLIQLNKPGLVFNSYGGVMGNIPATATPFPHRAGNLYKIQYSISWHEAGKEEDDTYIGLIRELYSFMTPYVSKNPRGCYFNYRDLDIGENTNGTYVEGKVYGRKYFGVNFDRLVKVKGEVDPTNFFRNEQSIPLLNS